MDTSTYLRVGQVDLSIGRVVFKNTRVFRERRTFFLDLGLDGAVIVGSKGEQCSRMEEGAEKRRVIGGWLLAERVRRRRVRRGGEGGQALWVANFLWEADTLDTRFSVRRTPPCEHVFARTDENHFWPALVAPSQRLLDRIRP